MVNVKWIAGSLALVTLGLAFAGPAPITEPHDPARCAPDGIALGGLDILSYHQPGGPAAGDWRYRAEHSGLTYLFRDVSSRDAFLAQPDEFLPAYGGWCATTLALGSLVCPDYRNFKIEDGRLLLFETTAFTNGRALWESDPEAFRQRADARFSGFMER